MANIAKLARKITEDLQKQQAEYDALTKPLEDAMKLSSVKPLPPKAIYGTVTYASPEAEKARREKQEKEREEAKEVQRKNEERQEAQLKHFRWNTILMALTLLVSVVVLFSSEWFRSLLFSFCRWLCGWFT
jgi:cation transport ATPase